MTAQETVELYAEIGTTLRRLRTSLGLSLTQVEAKSDGRIASVNLRSWETASRRISIESLYLAAEFYGVSPTALLPHASGSAMVPVDVVIKSLRALAGDRGGH